MSEKSEHLKAMRENCRYIDRMREEERKKKGRTKKRKKKKKNAWMSALKNDAGKRDACGRPQYHSYIKSPAWFRVRNAALAFYKNRCDMCGSTVNLQVHHKTYKRLGREEMRDLQVLCGECHQSVHETSQSGKVDHITERFLDSL